MNVKLIAVVGACFVAGAGGGAVLHLRGAAHPEDSAVHADSTHADGAAEADAHEAPAVAAASPAHAGSPADHDSPARATVAEASAHDPPPQAPEPPPAQAGAAAEADSATARLARIFGAMRPEEAARLLEPLPEGDVRAVLFSLSERKAAAILANFKGERATALTRALLAHAGAR